MAKVVVKVPFTKAQEVMLADAAKQYRDDMIFLHGSDPEDGILESADALIGNIAPARVKDAKRLSWMQLNSAGADAFAKEGIIPEGVMLTCATGAYGTAIAEYMTAMLLVMMKKVLLYHEDQKKGVWTDEGDVASPAGKRILIVGTGDIGLSFAKRIRSFGLEDYPMTLVGIRRRAAVCPDVLDEIHPIDELEAEVAKADVIAVALPGTPATKHLFDQKMLKACKEGAYFMNVGRGNVVDNRALLDPEVYSRFGGMWLDVFEQEPLPEQDPLYSVPGLIVTPHITGQYHLDITLQRIAEISLNNYRAWHGEGAYKSVVDLETGYAR